MLARSTHLYRDSFSGLSYNVWMLSLILLINRSGTMVIPFLTIYLSQELGFSLSEAGFVMSAFGLGSVGGSYMGGWLSDRIHYLKIMFWSLLLSGMLFLFLMYLTDFWSMCIMVFSISVIADAFRPASMTAVAAYSSPENLTRSISLLRLAINLGFAIGPAIGGWMAHSFGYAPLFIADGLTCMGAAILFRMIFSRPVQKEQVKEELVPSEEELKKANSPYQDRIFLIFLVLNIINCIAFFQLIGTLPIYFREELLFSELLIGALMAMNGLLIAVVEMPVVYVLENRYTQLNIIAFGALLIGLGYLALTLGGLPLILLAILCILLLSIGEILNFPFTNTFAIGRSQKHNRGKYMGLYTSCFSIALVISPTVGMYIADSVGFTILWLSMGCLSLLATAGFGLLRRWT